MRKFKFFTLALIAISMFAIESCGPVLITSRFQTPPPPWFYPNRAETLRYVYFPDHLIYYDLSLRTYIYLNNGTWISASILPPRFNRVNFRRSRSVRVHNYFGDDIRTYHNENKDKIKGRRSTGVRRNN